MGERLDLKLLAKYPFLKESQEYVGFRIRDLNRFLDTGYGRIALNHAAERVKAAISFRGAPIRDQNSDPERSLFSYALARLIVSCIAERDLIERLSRYEAARAIEYFVGEDEEIQKIVSLQLDIDPDSMEMPVTRYVELAASLRDSSWRLVNRAVRKGKVQLKRGEVVELMKEQIRLNIQRQLPLEVNPELCGKIGTLKQEVLNALLEQTMQQFGEVQESSFPPCMQMLIEAITSGKNLPHQGRFALTAFLHTIGLSNAEIIEIYRRAPDFDISKTMYQVDHIAGSRGTEYTPPSCATMRTYGLCTGRDEVCERIGHPLTYYLKKKGAGRGRTATPSRGVPAEDPAGSTHQCDVDEKRQDIAWTRAGDRGGDSGEDEEQDNECKKVDDPDQNIQ